SSYGASQASSSYTPTPTASAPARPVTATATARRRIPQRSPNRRHAPAPRTVIPLPYAVRLGAARMHTHGRYIRASRPSPTGPQRRACARTLPEARLHRSCVLRARREQRRRPYLRLHLLGLRRASPEPVRGTGSKNLGIGLLPVRRRRRCPARRLGC